MTSLPKIIRRLFSPTQRLLSNAIHYIFRQTEQKQNDQVVEAVAQVLDAYDNIRDTKEQTPSLKEADALVEEATKELFGPQRRKESVTPKEWIDLIKSVMDVDDQSALFFNSSAKLTGASQVVDFENSLSNLISTSKERLAYFTNQFLVGRMSADQWKNLSERQIRAVILAAGILGAGGLTNISQRHVELVSSEIGRQLQYFKNFSEKLIAKDRDLMNRGNPSLLSRVQSYANGATSLFQEAKRLSINEQTEGSAMERRILGACEGNCPDCANAAELGWQKIGTLPRIGDSKCGQNCCCSFEYQEA